MASGRISDNTLVGLMLALVALGGAAAFGAQSMIARGSQTQDTLALERQPAELIWQPETFAANLDVTGCGSDTVTAAAIDLETGAIRWEQDLPGTSVNGNVLTVLKNGTDGHIAVHIDAFLEELPPSLMAVDVATGELLWQRFLAAHVADRFAISETEIAVEVTDPILDPNGGTFDSFVIVDASGQVEPWFPTAGDAQSEPFDTRLASGYRFADSAGRYATMVDDSGRDLTGDPGGQATFNPERMDLVSIHDSTDGTVSTFVNLPLDGEFNTSALSASIGHTVYDDGEHLLVVIGSHQGPNTRFAMFDRQSGELLWSLDDVRAGALANLSGRSLVVYDKRNDEPAEAESTRDLFVVAADDPEDVQWSTELSVNEGGGNGFLGTVGNDLVFAVDDDAGDMQFLRVTDQQDVPDLLPAAEGYGSGAPSLKFHLDDEVMAAVTDDGVLMQRHGQAAELIEFENPVNQVVRVDDMLLVNQWHCPNFG